MRNDDIAIPADPDDSEDFEVTQEALERGLRARLVRRTRAELGLTQPVFASRFRVPVGTLRDWEQARVTPPDYAVAYLKVIGRHADLVADAVS